MQQPLCIKLTIKVDSPSCTLNWPTVLSWHWLLLACSSRLSTTLPVSPPLRTEQLLNFFSSCKRWAWVILNHLFSGTVRKLTHESSTDAIISKSSNGLFNFMLLLLNCFPHPLVEYMHLVNILVSLVPWSSLSLHTSIFSSPEFRALCKIATFSGSAHFSNRSPLQD